ncbi:AI-2E family transporter [Microbacterium sp. F2]|uniref:AI-2E family transporter n=1 Tax=Microbacterium sp. F2 TaxID=3422228 RepID=UPI003FD17021
MSSAPPSEVPSSSSPMLRVLIGLAAAVVVLVGLSWAREIVGPLALAAVIVIICHPLQGLLRRRGWPMWTATTAVILLAYVILTAMALLLLFAGTQFARLVVNYVAQLQTTVDGIEQWLADMGWDRQAADTLASFLEPSRLLSVATSVSGMVVGVAIGLFFVLAYVIFMAADAARYNRLRAVFGSAVDGTLARVRTFTVGTRRYYIVNAIFGAIVAIIDGIALAAIGVPAPVVWAILAFVTNFIPNIGFILGLIPPAVLALVVGGWPLFLAVIAIYCIVNVVLQVLVQPKFVADAVSLSLTLSFFSVIFWTFVIGPLGAILSIPLTLLVRALILEADPNARVLRWLSGDRDAAPVDDSTEAPRDDTGVDAATENDEGSPAESADAAGDPPV